MTKGLEFRQNLKFYVAKERTNNNKQNKNLMLPFLLTTLNKSCSLANKFYCPII